MSSQKLKKIGVEGLGQDLYGDAYEDWFGSESFRTYH